MRKLILKNSFSVGDIVLLTAAVRDLHQCYPNRFVTDVRTSCTELWENNPYLIPLDENDAGVEVIECHYPLINRCNKAPCHCLLGFTDFLNERLGLQIRPTVFKGDIHVSKREKSWFSQVHELTGEDTPFWIVAGGGKYDVTIKWWETRRYQEVIDHFRGKILFVQVGESGHHHPKLAGVIDLRGKTTLRQLVRLVYHTQGILCPVTSLMHLAAAVETKDGNPSARPCVVVAGGREPVHWEAYPHHQFIHTIGALPCCQTGGCWRSRTTPLGDGDERDNPERLCVDVAGGLPRCMDMITSDEVIRRLELYVDGGVVDYLSAAQAKAAQRAIRSESPNPFDDQPLDIHSARLASEEFIRRIPPYPRSYAGRGIVICGGGVKYFINAWVCINMLRRLGCSLPIQLWHLGSHEFDHSMELLVGGLGVQCIDASKVRKKFPARILHGWELKAYAILHCPFKEVLLLDADNVPVVNPEFLFTTPQYKTTGAIFWPDWGHLARSRKIWQLCGVPFRDEPEIESGQILVDKERCWRPLKLCMWYNENSDFFYRHVHGDKDTFHLAFRKLEQPYSMPAHSVRWLRHTMCQHDFDGRRIFQHRNGAKWDIFENERIEGFEHEDTCREFIARLRGTWDGRMGHFRPAFKTRKGNKIARELKIQAVMISCPQRDSLRAETLRHLSETDWGGPPVIVQMDPCEIKNPKDSGTRNSYRALERSLKLDADYVLFLEDDLEFNRFLWHNLLAWEPLRNRKVTLAGLYNQNLRRLACDTKNHSLIIEPYSIFGSQAFLISRRTVEHLVEHWEEEIGGQDLRMARLAAGLQKPILYHAPSLVQHVGRKSVWGGPFIQAADYDQWWRAP